MRSKGYTLLGWLVWRAAKQDARQRLSDARARLGPLAVIAAVVAAGIALGRGDEE